MESTPSQPTDPVSTSEAPKQSFWKRAWIKTKEFIERINIVHRISAIVGQVGRFINSSQGSLFLFLLVPTVISAVGLIWHNVHVLGTAGIIWMCIWLTLFAVAIWISENLEKWSEWTTAGTQLLEQTKGQWPALAANWLMKKMSEYCFTFAGIAITVGFIFTQIHLWFIRGFSSGFFSHNLVGWIIFGLLPTIIGRLSDAARKLDEAKKTGQNVILIGIAQFYISFVLLITGAIGGAQAFEPLYYIKRRPWEIIQHDLLSVPYADSYSYAIKDGMGSVTFLIFYFFIPAYLVLTSWLGIQALKAGEAIKSYSKGTFYWIIALNVPLVIIGLIAGWNEGWVQTVLGVLLLIIIWMVEQLGHLYHWIVGLFS